MKQSSLPRITSLLEKCAGEMPPFPPTDLYNEGWLLRLTLDWYSTNRVSNSPFEFFDEAKWFSEASLPSPFLPRYRGDKLAESWTRADGIIGHFDISHGRTGCKVHSNAKQFVVTEAKIFSKLASGVKNAPCYDQAARNVACMAEGLSRGNCRPDSVERLAFVVVAPQSQITAGVFKSELAIDSINHKVHKRISKYECEKKDQWFSTCFLPTLDQIKVQAVSWESLIDTVAKSDTESYDELKTFYSQCLKYNDPAFGKTS